MLTVWIACDSFREADVKNANRQLNVFWIVGETKENIICGASSDHFGWSTSDSIRSLTGQLWNCCVYMQVHRCKQLFLHQQQQHCAKPFSRLEFKTNTLTWKRLLLCFGVFFSSTVRCVTFISRNICFGHFLTPVLTGMYIPVGASRPYVRFVPVKYEASLCRNVDHIWQLSPTLHLRQTTRHNH